MYGFCSNNALYSANLSNTVFFFKFLLIPRVELILLKNEEVAFPQQFIFVFIPYFVGVIMPKNSFPTLGIRKKDKSKEFIYGKGG